MNWYSARPQVYGPGDSPEWHSFEPEISIKECCEGDGSSMDAAIEEVTTWAF